MKHDRAKAAYRAAVAAQMRLTGQSYDEIAGLLGFRSRSGAWKAVQRSLSERRKAAGSRLWARELADLDLLQERNWQKAMSGDPKAILTCVRVIELRTKLHTSPANSPRAIGK